MVSVGALATTVLMAILLVGIAGILARIEDWRSYTIAIGGGHGAHERTHAEKPSGILRWLTTVDHKDIGILYGVFAVVAFAWGGIAVVLMRFELMYPLRTSSVPVPTTAS